MNSLKIHQNLGSKLLFFYLIHQNIDKMIVEKFVFLFFFSDINMIVMKFEKIQNF
jgi:hypothetical protein